MSERRTERIFDKPLDNLKVLQTGLTNAIAKELRSEITYELVSGADAEGSTVPVLLGRGRFAKVYKAWQRSSGHNVRPVAIKILHENLDQRGEQLFHQEISLLKKLSSSTAVNAISILDILQLGPMAMCANCAQIYHPRCPLCGEHPLERFNPPSEAYPALRCRNHGRCKYVISGEHVLNSSHVLFQPPSKTCCAHEKGARAQRGTLINFVDRDAVVMEFLGQDLPHFHESRRRTYARLCRQHGVLLPGPLGELGALLEVEPIAGVTQLTPARPQEIEFVQKVILLEKMLLMVQLAESVAWLHGEQQIVHKDISPDNIMVAALPVEDEEGDDWRGLLESGLGEALTSLATYPSFTAQVIDFGLADHVNLTRHWYEEPVQNFAAEKLSYLSLEARQRKRRIYQRIDFDLLTRTFVIPDALRPDKAGEQAIKIGDLLIDESDPSHYFCIEITGVEQDAQDPRTFRASFSGDVPPNPHGRQFDLVHRLGEPHDIYALGAVFYFILTGEHTDVRKLTNIADLLQDAPQPLRADVLEQCIPSYKLCRDRLPEPHYQDDLMILILRAMVRSQPESFVQSRIDRGPEPARRLLHDTRHLYNRLKSELLSASTLRSLDELRSGHVRLLEAHNTQGQQLAQARAANEILHDQLQRDAQASRQQRSRLLGVMALVAFLSGGAGAIANRMTQETPATVSGPDAARKRTP